MAVTRPLYVNVSDEEEGSFALLYIFLVSFYCSLISYSVFIGGPLKTSLKFVQWRHRKGSFTIMFVYLDLTFVCSLCQLDLGTVMVQYKVYSCTMLSVRFLLYIEPFVCKDTRCPANQEERGRWKIVTSPHSLSHVLCLMISCFVCLLEPCSLHFAGQREGGGCHVAD